MCPISVTRCTDEDAKQSVLEGYAGLRTLKQQATEPNDGVAERRV